MRPPSDPSSPPSVVPSPSGIAPPARDLARDPESAPAGPPLSRREFVAGTLAAGAVLAATSIPATPAAGATVGAAPGAGAPGAGAPVAGPAALRAVVPNADPLGTASSPRQDVPRAVGRPMPPGIDLGDPPARRLGLAVVGLGNYALGQILPRIARTRHVRLAALVSGNPEKARAVAAAYQLPERAVYSYETFDRLREDASVDAVYVVLPPALHAEWTVRAAGIGKHVLCEKPMAATSAECRRMIDACARAGRRLMIGYRVHWEPHNVEAVRLIRAGELGPLRQIVAQHGGPVDPTTPYGEWRVQRALAGGGSLWDIGIYSLNGARLLSGAEPTELRATMRRPPPQTVRGRAVDVEMGLDWSMRFPGGLVATCTSSYDAQANRIQVLGDAGSLDLSPATSYVGDTLRVRTGGVERTPNPGESEQQFLGMLDEFALAVREGREPATSGREGLRDVQIMELIYDAARTERPVQVPAAG